MAVNQSGIHENTPGAKAIKSTENCFFAEIKALLEAFLILLFVFAGFFDPVGANYGLRWIGIVAMLALSLKVGCGKARLPRNVGLCLCYLILLMPVHGLIMMFINGGINSQYFIDTSYIAFSVLLMASIPVILVSNYYQVYFRSIIFFSILLSFLSVGLLFGLGGSWVANFLTERSIAIIAEKSLLGVKFSMIYFLASPLLFIPLTFFLIKSIRSRVYILWALFPMSALIFTATRSHIMLTIIYVAWLLPNIVSGRDSDARFLTYKIICALISCLLLLLVVGDTLESLFSSEKRVALLTYYVDTFDNPVFLLFGQGFNATEWDLSLSSWTGGGSKVELTYLEYIRVFGLFGFTAFCFFVAYVFRKLLKNNFFFEMHLFSLILINASINPYLISINGVIPIALVLGRLVAVRFDRNAQIGN